MNAFLVGRTAFLLAVFHLIVLPIWSSAQAPSSFEELDRYRSASIAAVQRLNQVLGKNGLPLLNDQLTRPTTQTRPDRFRKIRVVQFGGSGTPVEFTFLPGTAQIIGMQRYGVVTKESPRFDTPPKPKWSANDATVIAKALVQATIASFPSDAGEPTTAFEPKTDLPKYLEGRWFVQWPRSNGHGHLFQLDCINATVAETIGPIALSYNFFSNYSVGSFQPIPREKAFELALPRAREIMNWPPIKGRFRDFRLKNEPKSELLIVNPNHITKLSDIDALALAHETNARLAWVVSYTATYGGRRTGRNLIPVDSQVQVFIDAETGFFLGGDVR